MVKKTKKEISNSITVKSFLKLIKNKTVYVKIIGYCDEYKCIPSKELSRTLGEYAVISAFTRLNHSPIELISDEDELNEIFDTPKEKIKIYKAYGYTADLFLEIADNSYILEKILNT